MRILLIAGGWSTEREVSLNGAASMRLALEELGHTVTLFDLERFDDLLEQAFKHDLAIINLHGDPGEDGLVQAILDQVGLPYQGTGAQGSLLALHKVASKQIVRRAGLLTPNWEFLPRPPKDSWEPKLSYPIFAKSETGGSSIHLAQAANRVELDAIMAEIFQAGATVLLEEAISGAEVTCGILGESSLPPVLIEPVAGSFFDYTSKYAQDGAREICPAPLPPEITTKIQETALKIHNLLGLEGLSRSDFILQGDQLYFLEVNTLPGMTKTSLVPQEARVLGLEFKDLMAKFIELALNKRK